MQDLDPENIIMLAEHVQIKKADIFTYFISIESKSISIKKFSSICSSNCCSSSGSSDSSCSESGDGSVCVCGGGGGGGNFSR